MGETTRQAFSEELHRINIKMEKNDESKMKVINARRSGNKQPDHIEDDSTSDSVEEVPGNFNEIIVLDESEMPPNVTERVTSPNTTVSDFNSPVRNVPGVGCKDCEDVRNALFSPPFNQLI